MKWRDDLKVSVSYQEPQWQSGYVREMITGKSQWERFRLLCECLDITGEMLERPLQSYSSGEKSKVDVARALSEKNDLLLLDEPLNYMEIYFREQLKKAILVFKPTMIFVQHDEKFGCHVATRTVDLKNGNISFS